MREALVRGGMAFTEESAGVNLGMDFHLTDYGIHIEVKQFHSPRISDQMARAPNVIAVQGRAAVEFLAGLLSKGRV